MKKKILFSPLIIIIFIIIAGIGIAGAASIIFGGTGDSNSLGVNLQKGLVGWWKLDGNANDSTSYQNDGTVTGATLTTDRKGQVNKAYSFNGTSNYINPGTLTLPNTSISVSAWVKGSNDQTAANWAYILIQNTGHEVEFGVYANSGNLIMKDNSGTGNPTASGVMNITDNQWHHVVGTIDSGAGTINTYIDGVFIDSTPYAGGTAKTGLYNIGGDNGSLGWKGSIDDVRIYNRALSQAEIIALYQEYNPGIQISDLQKGLVGQWEMDGNANDTTSYTNDGTVTGAVLANDRKGQAQKAYGFDGSSDYITATDADSLEIGTSDFTLSAWVNVDNSITNAKVNAILSKGAENQVLRSETFDNAAWANFCASGTMTANTTDFTAPDGTNTAEKIVTPGGAGCGGSGAYAGKYQTISTTGSSTQYTVSIWARGAAGGEAFKLGINDIHGCDNTLTTSWARYTCTFTVTDTSRGFQFYVNSDGVVATYYVWGAQREMSDSSGIYATTTSSSVNTSGYSLFMDNATLKAALNSTTLGRTATYSSLSLGAWHHIVAAYNRSGSVTLYADGVSAGTTSISSLSGVSITNARDFLIGGTVSERINDFSGQMDDIRIYNRVLSATEVTALYQEYNPGIQVSDLQKGLVGQWKMDGDANDATSYTNDGTVTGATLTTDRKGQTNKAYSFDGGFDGNNINAANGSSLSFGTGAFSISLWISALTSSEDLPAIIEKGNGDWSSGGGQTGWFLGSISGTNTWKFSMPDGAGNKTHTSFGSLNNAGWKYLTVVVDSASASSPKTTTFIDGVQFDQTTRANVTTTVTNVLSIGRWNWPGLKRSFKGSIDDVRIYNRALNQTEITQLYESY